MTHTTRRLALAAVLAAAMLLAAQVPGAAQEGGVIEGQVVNGTAGAPAIGAGVPVTVHILQGEVELETRQATTDEQGRFRFEDLPVQDAGQADSGLSYLLDAVYQGVTYRTPDTYRFQGSADQPGTIDAKLPVYETTGDPSKVTIDSVHIIAEGLGPVMRLTEVVLFGNQGDRTYVGRPSDAPEAGGRNATVSIPLPEGAVGLSFDESAEGSEGRYIEVEGGLVDTEPVPPGNDTLVARFSYHLMSDGTTLSMEHPFAYPVGSVNILAVQPGLTVQSGGSQIAAQGAQSMGDNTFEVYTAEGVGPDQPLLLELVPAEEGSSMMPAASEEAATPAPAGQQDLIRSLGIALVLAAVVGAGVYVLATRPTPVAARSASGALAGPQARALLSELADLELAFQAGQIDQATFERERAAKVGALQGSGS